MILFLKSAPASDEQMPLHEKLILVFKDKVKNAETDEDRERAERDLAKLQASASEE
jgi:hypothetical protein